MAAKGEDKFRNVVAIPEDFDFMGDIFTVIGMESEESSPVARIHEELLSGRSDHLHALVSSERAKHAENYSPEGKTCCRDLVFLPLNRDALKCYIDALYGLPIWVEHKSRSWAQELQLLGQIYQFARNHADVQIQDASLDAVRDILWAEGNNVTMAVATAALLPYFCAESLGRKMIVDLLCDAQQDLADSRRTFNRFAGIEDQPFWQEVEARVSENTFCESMGEGPPNLRKPCRYHRHEKGSCYTA